MASYDPLSADILVDATINSVTYIVKSFNRRGAAHVGVDFSTSAGGYRGMRGVSGKEMADMTIERTNAAQAIPAQYGTLTYDGSNFVIEQVAVSKASASASTIQLTLSVVP